MARPPRDNRASVVTKHMSLRMTAGEKLSLDQLAALLDPQLGSTPAGVLRALVRQEARARGLKRPKPDLGQWDPDPTILARRLRRLERLYDERVGPAILSSYGVPPLENALTKILAARGLNSNFVALLRSRRGDETPMRFRARLSKALDDMEERWAIFRRS